MSKQEYITQLLASNEAYEGIIEQSLYDFLVKSLQGYFNLTKSKAQKYTIESLRALYVEVA